ncbi:MAG: Re/Si-specific NAD(P)(+) transhydrogenase subunit alpha [Acidobacteria bacterium]|nr:MAG: Re/Si-specific NAD(P)(+) transhydrogenase subunit alpha [Acidobacteriota bacterium]REK08389.1 MAG: Re/Si-specific NAD(P)(+) transhydrogenase subunit alpha [Acidobacteriota bacterium]
MKIAVPLETYPGERRVALTPQSVKQLVAQSYEVLVQTGAGEGAGYSDAEFEQAGARCSSDRAELIGSGDVVLQVRGLGANPEAGQADLELFERGPAEQISIAQHDPLWRPELAQQLSQRQVRVLALETIPRISRAQSMDVLSSMATIAGYKAVLLAADRLPQMFPMLMTAAGTVSAARVFVIGAGVAGLQAIATARRLGAIVQGYDIRPAAAEQIRSLGAKSVELPVASEDAEDAGGYARAQGEEFNRRQRELLAEVIAASDVVITTAAIPGAPSPVLITAEMVAAMKPGSVIVDLAAERGGNCELTEADRDVSSGGVTVLGPTDLPSRVPRHASQMFSNNLTTLIKHLTHEGHLELDLADEITHDVLVADRGEVLHPRMRAKLGLPESESESETETETETEAAE